MEIDMQEEIDQTKSIMEIVKGVEEQIYQMDLSDPEILEAMRELKKFTQNYCLRLVNSK